MNRDHNDYRNLDHPRGPPLRSHLCHYDQQSSEEVTLSAQNNFVSIVIIYRSIIRIVFFNLSKTISFTKRNYENSQQL